MIHHPPEIKTSEDGVGSEFFIPRRLEDLEVEDPDRRLPNVYYVDGIMEVDTMSASEQISTLQAILHELNRRDGGGVLSVVQSGKFDTLYSFLRHKKCLSRECKVTLSHELPQLLTRLCKQVAQVISRARASSGGLRGLNSRFYILARSALKMYCFLLSQVLLLVEDTTVPADGTGDDALASQVSSQRSFASSRKRGRAAHQRAAQEVSAVIDLSTKEMALTALQELLSSDLTAVWSGGSISEQETPIQASSSTEGSGHIEESMLNCLLTVCIAVLLRKGNLFDFSGAGGAGELTAVGQVLHLLLAALAYHYTKLKDREWPKLIDQDVDVPLQECGSQNSSVSELKGNDPKWDEECSKTSEDSFTEKNTLFRYLRMCSVHRDVRDIVITPLCELILKYDFVAQYMATFLHVMDRDFVSSDDEIIKLEVLLSECTNPEKTYMRPWAKRIVYAFIEQLTGYCGVESGVNLQKPPATNVCDSVSSSAPDLNSCENIHMNSNATPEDMSTKIPMNKEPTIIHYVSNSVLNMDSATAKNIVLFFDYLSENHITTVTEHISLIHPLLNACENYDIRKTVMTAITELVAQKHGTEGPSLLLRSSSVSTYNRSASVAFGGSILLQDGTESDTCSLNVIMKSFLADLLARFMDINPVVRTHCLKVWSYLWERRSVPLTYQLQVVECAVQRLADRNNHVRKAAFSLLHIAVRRNSVGGRCLSLGKFEEKLRIIEEEIQRIQANIYELVGTESNTKPSENICSPEVFTGQPNELSDSLDIVASSTQNMEIRKLEQLKSDSTNKIEHYKRGILFIGSLHRAVDTAFSLLNSKVVLDVLESIDFISLANEYRIDYAVEHAHHVFPLVYSNEPQIQEAVRISFANTMFLNYRKQTNIPLLKRNLACVRKLMSVVSRAGEGFLAAMETICQQLPEQSTTQNVITDDLLGTLWSLALSKRFDNIGEATSNNQVSEIIENQKSMRLFAMISYAYPKGVRERIPDMLQDLFPNFFHDHLLCAYACQALERLRLLSSFSLLSAEDPLIVQLRGLLCHRTSKIHNWLMMADCVMSAIGTLCNSPREAFSYAVMVLRNRAQSDLKQWQDQIKNDPKAHIPGRAINSLTQFCFALGHAALKEFVYVDNWERTAMHKLEKSQNDSKHRNANEGSDAMQKELGFDSKEYKREEIREQADAARTSLMDATGLYAPYLAVVLHWVGDSTSFTKLLPENTLDPGDSVSGFLDTEIIENSTLRATAMLTLSKLMIIDEKTCRKYIDVLFTVLKGSSEWWIRTNCLISLGDLLCCHPNLVQPYLHPSKGHLTSLLREGTNRRVRSTTVMVCTHLALNDMLRVPEMTPHLLVLIADDDIEIRKMGEVFLRELHNKNKRLIYNLLPSICMHLCTKFRTAEHKFQVVMRCVIEKIEKDRQTESSIEKLCQRFPTIGSNGIAQSARINAKYLSFCLTEFNYQSDKAIQKIVSDACFTCYKKWLFDEQVRQHFFSILAKSRKGFAASTSSGQAAEESTDAAKSNTWEKRGRTAMLEEWETKLSASVASYSEVPNAEVDVSSSIELGTASEAADDNEQEPKNKEFSRTAQLKEAECSVMLGGRSEIWREHDTHSASSEIDTSQESLPKRRLTRRPTQHRAATIKPRSISVDPSLALPFPRRETNFRSAEKNVKKSIKSRKGRRSYFSSSSDHETESSHAHESNPALPNVSSPKSSPNPMRRSARIAARSAKTTGHLSSTSDESESLTSECQSESSCTTRMTPRRVNKKRTSWSSKKRRKR